MTSYAEKMATARALGETPYGDLLSYRGDACVVTGGAKGIGLAIGRRFAELGGTVTLVDIDPGVGDVASELSASTGGRVLGVTVDVCDSAAVTALARGAYRDASGRLVWVNNAGIYPTNRLEDLPDEAWQRVIDLDLTATFYGCRAAGLTIRERGGEGVIVNMSSVAGFRTGNPPGIAHYASAKHAVQGLTKAMAVELGGDGVRVVAIAPGTIISDGLLAKFGAGDDGVDPYERLARRMPLGRAGVPDDVARLAVFLASRAADMITGAIVPVDAGHLAI